MIAFSRTWRAIEADRSERLRVVCFLSASAILAAWVAWSILARVPVYCVSEKARIEVDQVPRRIEAPDQSGEVSVLRMSLGKRVKAGEILAKLDTGLLSEQRGAQEHRSAGLLREAAVLGEQIQAVEQGLAEAEKAAEVSLKEAQALHLESKTQAQSAQEDARRAQDLAKAGHISERDLEKALAEAQARKEASEALRLRVDRLDTEARATESDRRSELDRLRGRLERLRGDAAMAKSAADGLGHVIEHNEIVAQVDGRIGEMRSLDVGSFVKPGEWLGTIIPDGDLRIVSQFPPSVLGRIQAGQPASMRLYAYPWIEYGSLPARVTEVASEPRDGLIRVELAIGDHPPKTIPVRHGLPGSLEIRVEEVSPLTLLLRAVGKKAPAPEISPSRTEGDAPTTGAARVEVPAPAQPPDEPGHVHEDGEDEDR